MKNFPMFLRMDGRQVVICGGGDLAARKARLLLKTEARLLLVAETLDPELQGLVAEGRADHAAAPDQALFAGAALVFIATGDADRDADLARSARAAGALVHVVDQPELSDAFVPSIVDRAPVVVAIGTEGTAPALGRALKTQIETLLSPRLGSFAALTGRLRTAVADRIAPSARRAFWDGVFSGEAWRAHLDGRERAAADLLKTAIAEGQAPATTGHIALVGAGPGARDLLTLRAVQRLQQADVIFYDRLVDPAILDLAPAEVDRVYVGKEVGACAWPQDKIDRLIVAEASKGRRVVRLKSGDPSVFGRACEEIAAANAAGIEVEIVPGITAASAAAASLKRPLTERGETDTLVITTGTCKPGDADPDRAALARPGTAMTFYMAVEKAGQVSRDLIAAGAPAACPVDIVAAASTARERHAATTLDRLADTIRDEGLQSPAILFIRYPKSLAAAAMVPQGPDLARTAAA